jgi:PEGA domain-containing protein
VPFVTDLISPAGVQSNFSAVTSFKERSMMLHFRKYVAIITAWMLLVAPFSFSQDNKQDTTAPTPAPPTASQSGTPTPTGPTKTPVKYTTDGRPILEEGTPVRMRLSRTLSSADALAGDRVDFEVLDPIKLGDIEVVPQGGIAWGTVTDAHPKRRMARGGKLDVNIDSVKLSNGDKAALRAVKEVKGGGHTGAMTGAMVATGIVFFPAAPLFLFMKGKDITIPKGTEITAYINADTPFATSANSASPTGVTASVVSPSEATVEITSTPDGADIEVDGAFRGNAPSTVTLPPGDHTITVKKSGFQNWERNIHVTSGNIKVRAELQAAN